MQSNSKLKKNLLSRELLYDTIRSYFKTKGFIEVETPILVNTPSIEPNLDIFQTTLNLQTGFSSPAYLITSPEYAMKKLISSNIGSCFQITKSFRNNEAASNQHNPEFSILEWYHVGTDYLEVMMEFETLFLKLVEAFRGSGQPLSTFHFQNQVYNLHSPWPRVSVREAFQKYAHINVATLLDEPALKQFAQSHDYHVSPHTTWEQIFYQIYFNQIEPHLDALKKPFFLYEYPMSQAALAKPATDVRFSERFEVFLGGMELGNCFSELTDPEETESRLKSDFDTRKRLGKSLYPLDHDFIKALRQGLPETAGIAVGLDRLLMLLLDVPQVKDTLLFPLEDMFKVE
jgi:lysyl-tRNA synthetase class 2